MLGARGKEKVLQGMLVKKVHVTPHFIHLLYFAYVKSQPWGYIFSPLLTLGIYFSAPFQYQRAFVSSLKAESVRRNASPSRLFPATNYKCGNPVRNKSDFEAEEIREDGKAAKAKSAKSNWYRHSSWLSLWLGPRTWC